MSKSIVKACVRYNDRLYTGFDHGECFKKLNEDNTILVHSDIEQGFVDSDGNFVDRKQAMIIAKESGQLRYEPNKETLISEDLHLDWLNKQAQRIAELEEQLKKFESIEKEIGCDIEVFWKVYRKISGHGNVGDLSLYTITDENEIIKIMPTEIISGTYSNYPQDCSFKYWIWDNVKGYYKHTYTYFHFHDYKRYWFLTKEEAEAKLRELKGA